MDKENEIIIKVLASESLTYEVPFQSIKSFSKINFKDKSMILPRFKVERMDNFLGDNNISRNITASNKGRLTLVNTVRQVRFDSISQRLRNDLINNITKANRSEILRDGGLAFLGDQGNISLVNVRLHGFG